MIKTELQGVRKSIILWEWLVDNFPKTKSDYPYQIDIVPYLARCPLCHYFKALKGKMFNLSQFTCKDCCLKDCDDTDSNFMVWTKFTIFKKGDSKKALQSAKNILKDLKSREEELTK